MDAAQLNVRAGLAAARIASRPKWSAKKIKKAVNLLMKK